MNDDDNDAGDGETDKRRLRLTIVSNNLHYYLPYVSMEGYIFVAVLFFCSAMIVAAIDVKFCMMVRIGPGQKVSPFGGGAPGSPCNISNFGRKFWLFSHEYLENSKSQRYMLNELNISSTGPLRKCKEWGGSSLGTPQ